MIKSLNKRLQILNSAKKLFLELGYKSTTIQSIATESGISKGAVYLYFKSKEAILCDPLFPPDMAVIYIGYQE